MQGLIGFSLSFIVVYLMTNVMISGQAFFIPFLIALIIAYFIIAFAEWIRKITTLPLGFSYILSISGIIFSLSGVSMIVTGNVQTLIDSAPLYQQKLEGLVDSAFALFKMPVPDVNKWFEDFNFSSLLGNLALMVKGLAGSTGMITLYVVFIMIEYHYFRDKLLALFSTNEGKESAEKIVSKIATKTKSYLRIKTLLSLLTSSLSYALMVAVGVDFAEFWVLLIFLLNYIPTIGSIVATVFPCLLTILQFETLFPFVVVTIGLVLIQFFIGNLLEPRVMGKQFNLSGLVILLSLTIWGNIWGIIGMFLCVPILMIISIVLANFPKTRPIAILLSQDGHLED